MYCIPSCNYFYHRSTLPASVTIQTNAVPTPLHALPTSHPRAHDPHFRLPLHERVEWTDNFTGGDGMFYATERCCRPMPLKSADAPIFVLESFGSWTGLRHLACLAAPGHYFHSDKIARPRVYCSSYPGLPLSRSSARYIVIQLAKPKSHRGSRPCFRPTMWSANRTRRQDNTSHR